MEKEKLKKIFEFLEEKGEHSAPLEKYSNRQLKEMVKPGFIDGPIVRD